MYTRRYLVVGGFIIKEFLSCYAVILWTHALVDSRWSDRCILSVFIPNFLRGFELSICIVRVQKIVCDILTAIKSSKSRLLKGCVCGITFEAAASIRT